MYSRGQRLNTAVFQTRDGSQVNNPTATATSPDIDENDNRLRYSDKLKYCTLCDPPEKLHDSLPKKINWNTEYGCVTLKVHLQRVKFCELTSYTP